VGRFAGIEACLHVRKSTIEEKKMRKDAVARFCLMIFGILLIAISSGCAVTTAPKVEPVETGALPPIQGKGTITLINDQKDTAVREFGRAGFGKLQGDLHTWTETAIQLLGMEMEKAGLKVQSGGEKSIKISVVDVKLGVSGVEFVASVAKGNVRIKVETGDGYSKEYEGEKNALQPPNSCEKALTEAVVNMLKDDHVVAYLKK
jgi:hypothetical protein